MENKTINIPRRRLCVVLALMPVALALPGRLRAESSMSDATYPIQKTEAEWRDVLTPEQFRVLRKSATERAFSRMGW